MTISTSIDFAVTRDEIITEALELLGVLGEGDTPTANQLTSCARTLNMMIKAWQVENINLFAIQKIELHPTVGTYEYSTDTWLCWPSYNYINATTTLAEALSVGETADIELASVTGFNADDIARITLNDGTYHYDTVASVDTVNTEIDLTTGTSVTVLSGNAISAFKRAKRPMKILNAVRHNETSGQDTPIEDFLSRQEYLALSDKDTSGKITSIYYDPQISPAKLYVWPAPDSASDLLYLYVQKTLADLDATSDNPEYPQEWYLALTYNLALMLVPKYGADQTRLQILNAGATYYKELAKSGDTEDYVKIIPSDY